MISVLKRAQSARFSLNFHVEWRVDERRQSRTRREKRIEAWSLKVISCSSLHPEMEECKEGETKVRSTTLCPTALPLLIKHVKPRVLQRERLKRDRSSANRRPCRDVRRSPQAIFRALKSPQRTKSQTEKRLRRELKKMECSSEYVF